jgi:hypothetical protein
MKSIRYAADEFLTGDAIADALVGFAAALAQHESSMAVDIPVRFASGEIIPVSFLLGPASQLVAVPMPHEHDEVLDDELVTWMRAETARVGKSSAMPVENAPNSRPSDDFDF